MPISSALGSSALLPGGLGFRNIIMNGDMRINQRNATITSSGYSVDRWYFFKYGGSAMSVAQSTDAPAGFTNSIRMTATVGIAAGTAAANYFEHRIEGSNTAFLAYGTSEAKQLTLSFWVRSAATGTHSIAFSNSAENRKYITTYMVNTTNTWEYKIITLPGDSSGTWLNNTGIGLRVYFPAQVGTDQQTSTVNSWFTDSSAIVIGASGTVDATDATNDIFAITGVQLEQNYQATSFEQRPISIELQLCQRYYYRRTATATAEMIISGFQPANSNIVFTWFHPVPMRANATLAAFGGTWSAVNSAAGPIYSNVGSNAMNVYVTVNAGISNANQSSRYSEVGAYIEVGCEL